jgi:hypothetical protein
MWSRLAFAGGSASLEAMRKLLVLAAAAVVLAPAAGAATRSPCLLVRQGDASTALGSKAGAGKAQTLGLYKACTYTSGKKKLTVLVRAVPSKSVFEKSAKKNPGPVFPIPGVGDEAFSAAAGTALIVWKDGVELTFVFVGKSPVVQTQKDLASAAVARLKG